jgi:integrase
MNVSVINKPDNVRQVTFESLSEQIVYELNPQSQEKQVLDLALDSIHLNPERISINFSLVDPKLVHHVKAWMSSACKKYANRTIYNVFNIVSKNLVVGECKADEIEEKIQDLVRIFVESDSNGTSQKSKLRSFYGWCVLHELPFFDEDFYDYYLEVKKFGSDEGKGKDVIIELPNRGPLTVKELKLFKAALFRLDTNKLSLQPLQGLVGLRLGQILGARDIQAIKLQFKHFKKSSDGTYYLEVPRAKQRGHKNNNATKRRPITNSLEKLLKQLKKKYEIHTNESVTDDWFVICNFGGNSRFNGDNLPTGVRVTPEVYRKRRLSILEVLDLGFTVTNRRLRKTFCTQLIAKGAPLKVVAELMDHSDLQQLEVYYRHTHHIAKKLDDVLKQQAADVLDAFAGKVIKHGEGSQQGQDIFATVGQQQLHLIGSCGSKTPCSLNPPLSCYGCSSLEAFDDADHELVVKTFVRESKKVFGEKHAIEILQHDDYLAASKFVQMLNNGEL